MFMLKTDLLATKIARHEVAIGNIPAKNITLFCVLCITETY
jgi:hypothetical protein